VVNSTRERRSRHHQSAKPYPEFPLTGHPTGRWCKKVRGRVIFFGKIDDPQAALDKWLKEKDELLAGRVPREQLADDTTLREVANAYLRHQQTLLDTGELSTRTFADNYRA
jgi:hypothetical protein